MVRYFLCSNEQHLQFAAEVVRNFWPLLQDKVCLLLPLEFIEGSKVGWVNSTAGTVHEK